MKNRRISSRDSGEVAAWGGRCLLLFKTLRSAGRAVRGKRKGRGETIGRKEAIVKGGDRKLSH